MNFNVTEWTHWQQHFQRRRNRPLPEARSTTDYRSLPPSLARSLAVFQLGESGGGTVVQQAQAASAPGGGRNYADALELFVREEHRHADMLECCISLLGGKLIKENWTARLFVHGRRLLGLRLKILVLLVAEIVGLCYYQLIARRLPECEIRSYLLQMVNDERDHLRFHCQFLKMQCRSRWSRLGFSVVWRVVSVSAAVVVMLDHQQSMRDMGISRRQILGRWRALSRYCECLVTEDAVAIGRTGHFAGTEGRNVLSSQA